MNKDKSENEWIEFNGNKEIMDAIGAERLMVKFEGGFTCMFNDDWPWQLVTHFKELSDK